MTNVDTFLTHYGVKGMRWGVRRDITPRASRRERLEATYRTKMSDVDAKAKADSRIRTEKILAISGGVLVGAAVATVVGAKLHKEFAPLTIKSSTSLQNVNDVGKDFDLNRVTFATFKKKDNELYRDKFAKEVLTRWSRNGNEVYATELKAVKDLKIPSRYQTKKLFEEWERVSGRVPKPGKTTIDRIVDVNRANQLSGNKVVDKSFISFVGKKGYDGIPDFMDQRNHHLKAKIPIMFVNGAQSLVVKGAEALDAAKLLAELRADD